MERRTGAIDEDTPGAMLKILLVDDDKEKLRRITTALQAVPGCQLENIDQTAYANEAKRFLSEIQYDLLILDIAIPARPDQVPSPSGGIALLDEILQRDSKYFRPKHIVGLTAFPDIYEKASSRFAEDLWMVIQYDGTTDHWAEQLQKKVEYILLVERSQPIPSHLAHLGIVAALATPELAAVLDGVPWEWSGIQLAADAAQYYKGRFKRGTESREVVAVAAPRMGIAAAAVSAMKLITAFRPRYLAIVGIAAGIKGRCQLGDIVVADPSWDWGSGKITSAGSTSRFEQAPHQIPLDSFLRSKLSSFARDRVVFDSIRREWKGSTINHILSMHVGPAASGAAVLADKKAVAQIVAQHRQLLAIEMETYGVYAAAQESPLPQPKAFSVKSICDFADHGKNDDYQAYASYTSSQALRKFAESYL